MDMAHSVERNGQKRVIVQKFGGTSVSTPERRQQVIDHVRRARTDGYQVALVVSAMGRRGDPYATDTLLDLLRSDGGAVAPDDYNLIFSCGEAISVAVMSQALKRNGIPATGLTAAQARIYSDGTHLEADVEHIDTTRLNALLAEGTVPVITGGQAVAPTTMDVTTLGRGGSDTSGVAVGAALGAARVEIFTDVDGVAIADPRLVPGARVLARVSYEAMYELARFGAKVVHPRALSTGWTRRTPIVVRSTFSVAPGTLISDVEDERPLVGLAALPPMDTVVVPAGTVAAATREAWERSHLVMTIFDNERGEVVVGAADDRAAELRDALREAALEPSRLLGRCCWLSVVGQAGALGDHHAPWMAGFAGQKVEVLAHERADRRITYVVVEGARSRAVGLLHETIRD
jgi:aspartate kinase